MAGSVKKAGKYPDLEAELSRLRGEGLGNFSADAYPTLTKLAAEYCGRSPETIARRHVESLIEDGLVPIAESEYGEYGLILFGFPLKTLAGRSPAALRKHVARVIYGPHEADEKVVNKFVKTYEPKIIAEIAEWISRIAEIPKGGRVVRQAVDEPHQQPNSTSTDSSPQAATQPVVLFDAISIYRAAVRILESCVAVPPQDRLILFTSLHGLDGRRFAHEEDPHAQDEVLEALASFKQAVAAKAKDGWHVKQIFNITTTERFAGIVDSIRNISARYWEIRAYCTVKAPPPLNALIVAKRELLLATDDLRAYGPRTCIHVVDDDTAAWASDWFAQVWDGAPFTLRTSVEVDEDEIARLDQLVNSDIRPIRSQPPEVDLEVDAAVQAKRKTLTSGK